MNIENLLNITFFQPYYNMNDLKYLIELQFNQLLPTFENFGPVRRKSVIHRAVIDTFNDQKDRKAELLNIIADHYNDYNASDYLIFSDQYFTITTNQIHYPEKHGGAWFKGEPIAVLYTVKFAGETWFSLELSVKDNMKEGYTR